MADKYTELLERFDPIAIARYQITAKDLESIEQYIEILQSDFAQNVWQEAVQVGGEYGTSIIIHEVTQIRALKQVGIDPLRYGLKDLQRILDQHRDAHVSALYEEHLYLQEVLTRKFGQRFQVATLVRANQLDDTDLNRFLESAIGIFLFEEDRVEQARQALERLKGR
ncbi:MAG: hypothetical protein HY741_22655 [Chloroflexi bacterium]|nr:hypothetical protein [Chloroflexota bacterium]